MEKIIENMKISYIDEGDSENIVVLLHGWGANKETMVPISNLIKDRYRVLVVDLPGFGESEEPTEVFDSYDYVRIIMKFLEELKIYKATFIGHSFGGKISAIIAAKYPKQVEKLVLIDSAGILPTRGFSYYKKVYSYKAAKWLYTKLPLGNKEDRLERFKSKFGSDDYRNSSGIMRNIMVTVVNENIQPLLKDIEADTLIVWGDQDDATPLYMAEIFEKDIKNSGLVVLNNSGHYSYIDDFHTFRAVINSYLKG